MLTTKDRYSLQVFDPKTANSAAFDKAIKIYSDTTDGRAKTAASQIVYWAERKPSDFSLGGDRAEIFGLLRDRTIIGFALGFYIPDERLYVVDHMAIAPDARSMTAFERFCDLIQGYVEREGRYIDYFVAEVSTDINDVDPLLNADTVTRLLQLKGFRSVDCEYWTPSPDRRPPYEPITARLLLHSPSAGKLAPSKLMTIVDAIHCGLYKNWYKPFAEDFDKYCRHLRDIRNRVESRCGNREYIALNGHPPLTAQADIRDVPTRPFVLAGYIIAVLLLTLAAATFVAWMGLSFSSIIGGAVAVGVCTLMILAIWFDSAARIVRYAIKILFGVFDK